MLNLLRMDLRRLFRSRSFTIVLAVAAGLTLMVIVVAAKLTDPETLNAMEADGTTIDENIWEESAEIRGMSQLEFIYECLNSGFLLMMTGIGMTLFVYSDFAGGSVKNICFASRRRDYVLSKVLLAGVYSALLVGAGILTSLVGPYPFGLRPAADSPLDIALYAFWVFLPHWAFALMALAFVLLTRGSTAGILMSVFSGSGLIAALLQKLCDLLGWPPLWQASLSSVVSTRCVPQMGPPQMTFTLACCAGWGILYTAASLLLMEKRDI